VLPRDEDTILHPKNLKYHVLGAITKDQELRSNLDSCNYSFTQPFQAPFLGSFTCIIDVKVNWQCYWVQLDSSAFKASCFLSLNIGVDSSWRAYARLTTLKLGYSGNSDRPNKKCHWNVFQLQNPICFSMMLKAHLIILLLGHLSQ
jgi:hypothetical protein